MSEFVLGAALTSMPQRHAHAVAMFSYLRRLPLVRYSEWLEDTPETNKICRNWLNARRALRCFADVPVTHVLICQDDLIFSPALPDVLGQLLDAVPTEPISLMTQDRKHVQQARDEQVCWLVGPNFYFAQAVIWPRDLAVACADWCDAHIPETRRFTNEDNRFGVWANVTNHDFYHTNPSLVQHIAADRALTTIPGQSRLINGHPYDAAWYDATGEIARATDWSQRAPWQVHEGTYSFTNLRYWQRHIQLYEQNGWTPERNAWFAQHDVGHGQVPVYFQEVAA